jgi:hypothetical protein
LAVSLSTYYPAAVSRNTAALFMLSAVARTRALFRPFIASLLLRRMKGSGAALEAEPASAPLAPPNPPRGSEFTFVCPCWATSNFFVPLDTQGKTAHVTFHGRDHFEASEEGRTLLAPLEEEQRAAVLATLEAEQARRASYSQQVSACTWAVVGPWVNLGLEIARRSRSG